MGPEPGTNLGPRVPSLLNLQPIASVDLQLQVLLKSCYGRILKCACRLFKVVLCTVDIELYKRAKPSGNLRTGLRNKQSIQLPFGTGYVGSGSDGLGTKLTGSDPLPNKTKTVKERPKNEARKISDGRLSTNAAGG